MTEQLKCLEKLKQAEREVDELRSKFGDYRDEIVKLKISRCSALKYFNALSEVWSDLPHSDTPLEEIIYLLKERDIEHHIKALTDICSDAYWSDNLGDEVVSVSSIDHIIQQLRKQLERGEV